MGAKEHRRKLTDVDFSKHEVNIKDIPEEFGVTIHELKIPGSSIYRVTFINAEGICAVTGDVGNWIFCREFIPSADGYVSEGYWQQKLTIASHQQHSSYSPGLTEEQIREDLNGGLEEYGWEGDELKEMKEYLQECLHHVDSEWDYRNFAYEEVPGFTGGDGVIWVEETNYQLKIVFDAFEEICNRIEDGL